MDVPPTGHHSNDVRLVTVTVYSFGCIHRKITKCWLILDLIQIGIPEIVHSPWQSLWVRWRQASEDRDCEDWSFQ